MSSCLLPQNDDPLPEIPRTANRPPRIDPETAVPALFAQHFVGMGCMPPKIEVAVEDLDTRDLIRIRWIVYGDNGVAGIGQIGDPSPLQPGSAVKRPLTAPLSLFTVTDLRNTGKGRRLELIVADGEFTIDATGKLNTISPTVDLPDGGTVVNTTYYDTYSWNIDTINQSCN